MEYNLKTAVSEMKRGEESGINYIYAKTYNYVYLRAKSIMKRESDIHQLMCDVYLRMIKFSAKIEAENLYEWLGKCVYKLGSDYYKKRKEREAVILEFEDGELEAHEITHPEEIAEVIGQRLEELPDLHQAMFYAFYYDYMSIATIARLMDCTEGVILNCLNYTRKYMIKALEHYREEKNVPVTYSVEAVCMALRRWSVDHCLSLTTAQSIYTEICKGAGVESALIYLEGKGFAGVNNTVVFHKQDDLGPIREQMKLYGKRPGPDKKIIGILAGIVLVVVIIVSVAFLFAGRKDEKKEDHTKVEDQNEEIEEPDEDTTDDESGENDANVNDSEYIFPDSDKRELTRAEVEALSKEELRLARNEIYARNGLIFDGGELGAYFSSKSWYKPTVPLDEFYDKVEMTFIEEKNIALIREVEATK